MTQAATVAPKGDTVDLTKAEKASSKSKASKTGRKRHVYTPQEIADLKKQYFSAIKRGLEAGTSRSKIVAETGAPSHFVWACAIATGHIKTKNAQGPKLRKLWAERLGVKVA